MQRSETGRSRTEQPKILVLGATGGTGRLIGSEDTWVHRSPLTAW